MNFRTEENWIRLGLLAKIGFYLGVVLGILGVIGGLYALIMAVFY